MKNLGRGGILHLGDDDALRVEAYAPVAGGGKQFRKIGFKREMIDYVFEVDEDISGITLSNGVTIPVALPYDALNARLYGDDAQSAIEGGINLCAVTGPAVGEVQALRLSKEFNPAAEAEEKPRQKKTADITMYVHHQPSDREFRSVRFHETQIDYFGPHPGRPDSETYVRLKTPIDGWTEFYIATPINNFTYYLNAARDRSGNYDLSEITRPKKTTDLKM